MLLDPDMILLRPLLHDFTDERVTWVDDRINKNKDVTQDERVVRHGHPIGQQDGYLTNEWMSLHTHQSLNFTPPSKDDGPMHYNSGPPYLMTVRDMYTTAVRWTELTPRVLEVYPKLFAGKKEERCSTITSAWVCIS